MHIYTAERNTGDDNRSRRRRKRTARKENGARIVEYF